MRPEHWLYTVPLRLRSLFRRAQVEQELAEELQFHLEQRIDELVANGTSRAEAQRLALRELGGIEQRKEECRDARRVRPLEDLVRDVIFGWRMLRKSPGFTSIVIIALALGIGANTALFSLFHQILLRSLPVQNPHELVVLAVEYPRWGQLSSFSYPMFRELRERSSVTSGMLAYAGVELNIGYAGDAQKATGQLVSGDYFAVLGVQPIAGRLLQPGDDSAAAPAVAVLSYSYWQRRFGGERSIVGREILLNGHHATVVGVTPPEFYGTDLATSADVRAPLAMTPLLRPPPANSLESTTHQWMRVMARLQPGIAREIAAAALDLLHTQIREQDGALAELSEHARKNILASKLAVLPGAQGPRHLQEKFAKSLRLLLAISGIILVITCASVANMLLARNATREPEVGMRLALGATRLRLARQWLTESALLALLGGGAGLLVAIWCQQALLSFVPAEQRANLSGSPDLLVLGFALVVALSTGLLFGAWPALQVSHTTLEQAQQSSPRFATGFRGTLVALQLALCLPLLIVAGLFTGSLRNTRLVPTGFDQQNVVLVSLDPTLNGYDAPRVQHFFDRVLQEIGALPQVESAGLATTVVLSGEADKINVNVEGYQPQEGEDRSPYMNIVSTGYFRALRLPFLLGRDFDERDNAPAARVAIINETMARYYFGSTNPIGKKFSTGDTLDTEIIGVVRDAKYVSLKEQPERHYYFPLAQIDRAGAMTLHVRANTNAQVLPDTLRAKLRQIDPNVPLYDVRTLTTEIDESLTQDRLISSLSTALGVLATLLATIGLYGVIAFSVARRTREIGIRMAVGAQRRDIFALVLKRVSLLIGGGLVAGVFLSLAGARFLGGILFGIEPADPLTFAAAILVLLAAASLAVCLPARRALQVNPSVALRYE